MIHSFFYLAHPLFTRGHQRLQLVFPLGAARATEHSLAVELAGPPQLRGLEVTDKASVAMTDFVDPLVRAVQHRVCDHASLEREAAARQLLAEDAADLAWRSNRARLAIVRVVIVRCSPNFAHFPH